MMNLKKITLKKLTMQNFKLNKLVKINFNLGLTELVGSNGVGKSSVLDAITFAFLGTNRFGVSSFDAINKDNTFCTVTVEFLDSNDKLNILERTQSISAKGAKSNNVYLNGEGVGTAKMNKMIDKDLFLSIINPTYFDSLSPAKGKDILLNLLDVKSDDILELMEEEDANVIKEYIDDLLDMSKGFTSTEAKEIKTSNNSTVKSLEAEYDAIYSVMLNNLHKLKDMEMDMLLGMKNEHLKVDDALDDLIINIGNLNDTDRKNHILELTKVVSSRDYISTTQLKHKNLLKLLEESEESCIEILKEIHKLKAKNKILDEYVNYELYLISNRVNNIMPNASIMIKDDRDKFVFKKLYNGDETTILSTSENIKFGIEFSKMLMFLSNMSLPIFIDNAESIVTLDKESSNLQLVSLAVERSLDLSIIEGDLVKNLETKETLPRKNINKVFVYRLYNDDVVEAIF